MLLWLLALFFVRWFFLMVSLLAQGEASRQQKAKRFKCGGSRLF